MTSVLLATKKHMGEVYLENTRRAVTKLTLHPLTVKRIKTIEKDGYQAIQVSYNGKMLTEIPFFEGVSVGDVIAPSTYLEAGSLASIQGTTKGKGFAGVVKRWNFGGGFKTHGQSDRHRAPGSIGQGTTPGRVHKGKKMAGRMGGDTHTVKNSLVVSLVDNIAWVTGPVPGNSKANIRLTITGKSDAPKVTFITGGMSSITPVEPEQPSATTAEESK